MKKLAQRARIANAVLAAALALGMTGASLATPTGVPVTAPVVALTPALPQPFADRLVPDGASSLAETQALNAALTAYAQQSDPTDLTPFESFLSTYPDGAWRVALQANLGQAYYHYGYFSRAFAAWEDAWARGKSLTDPTLRAIVDRAVGELIRMHARIGHAERMQALLKEVQDRGLSGPATEAVAGARQGLWLMQNDPGTAYLCGPMALKNLTAWALEQPGRAPLNASRAALERISAFRSGPNGVSLAEVGRLAQDAKLDVVPVHRDGHAPIPIPAIVHWKVNHYAALVEQRGDRYRLKDPTFGDELWIGKAALESEASGYYLIAARDAAQPGWRKVGADEAGQVRGMGNTTSNDPDRTGDDDCHCDSTGQPDPSDDGGMPRVSVHSMLVSLRLTDRPLGYRPARGPAVPIRLTYSQRDANQPASFNYFNLGPKWTFNWLSFIQDDPTLPGASVKRYQSGGGGYVYRGYDASSGQFTPERSLGATLVRSGVARYERRLPDGGVEVYAQDDGHTSYPRRIFLTQVSDAAGNTLTLTYDAQQRLTSLTDALGQVTTVQYANADQPLLITGFTDPFGRGAQIDYDSQGRLVAITDAIGMRSSFSYGSGTFINALTTPYGTTTFAYGESGITRWLTITDPLGHTERTEYTHQAPGIPFTEARVPAGIDPFNAYINYRNTYYWDAHAYATAPNDYTKAHITHWLHSADDTAVTDGAIESTKAPNEARVWFNYPGQLQALSNGNFNSPSKIGRVLDDGSTQLTQRSYNGLGNLTSETDPAGRTVFYDYAANGIDILQVRRQIVSTSGSDLLGRYTWNSQHRPLTITDAAGNVTTLTWSTTGKPLTITNPNNETTAYVYDARDQLIQIVNANGQTAAQYTYDPIGRLATSTDAAGYTLRYAYDNLDRPTQVTYPDGTTRTVTWDKLDVVATTDRLGRTSSATHDAAGRRIAVTDPLGHALQFGYDEAGRLITLTDANGNVTTWTRDIQGRVTAKADAAGIKTLTAYEASTSRVASSTDPLGQVKTYTYTVDGRASGITYSNANHATPAVRFTWDTTYPRLTSRTDGTGTTTTTYQYVPHPPGPIGIDLLASEDGPYQHDTLAWTYDALGRTISRSIDAATETFGYDTLGRLTSHTSPLGHATLGYLGETGQITNQSWTDRPFSTAYQYLPNSGDRRLQAIQFNGPNPQTLTYTSTPEDRITQIIDSLAGATQYTYDDADRLTGESHASGRYFNTTFDAAGNILTQQANDRNLTYQVNNRNQLTRRRGTAPPNDPDAQSRALDWDAELRLIRIRYKSGATYSGASTVFTYDGVGRRASIIEQGPTVNGVPATPVETRYRWCGETLCQARDANDNVIATYYPEGVAQGSGGTGAAQYYRQNHLGTVIATTDATGAVLSMTDYDAWGNATTAPAGVPGTTPLSYAGLYYHAPSGLYLANYRVYNSSQQRWISKDPIGEAGGVNLYGYVGGNPTVRTDILGYEWAANYGIGAFGGFGFGAAVAGGASLTVGVTSTGLISVQAQGSFDPVGIGAFVGWGAQGGVNYNWNPSTPSPDGAYGISAQFDGNIGWGAAVGGSASISPDGVGGSSGVTRVGGGFGAMASAGFSIAKSWAWKIPDWAFPWNWSKRMCKKNDF